MMLHRPLLVGLLAALLGVTAGGFLVATPKTLSAPPPSARVVAVVPAGTGAKLTLLDARTLKPTRPGWSRAWRQWREFPATLSPEGSEVAFGTVNKNGDPHVVVLDASTGRVVRHDEPGTTLDALYWLGGEVTRGSRAALLIAQGFHCSSSGCGTELCLGGGCLGLTTDDSPSAMLRDGVVMAPQANLLFVYPEFVDQGSGRNPLERPTIELPKLSSDAPFRVVADVGRDRLYVISSAGMVATITRASSAKPAVAYHRVALNGKPFEAAWAGSGRIALWGADGLGTIDVRTWKTHAIAPGVSGALATPHGIAAWTKTPDGIRVYKPDGTRRLQRLQGKQITTATAVGPTLYADTTARTRYSIDLRTGKTTGPLPTTARIVTPSYVVIP